MTIGCQAVIGSSNLLGHETHEKPARHGTTGKSPIEPALSRTGRLNLVSPDLSTAMIRNLAASTQVFTSNVFLVDGERTVLVDPGANFDVVGAVTAHVETIDAVVLTHTHPDHVGNTATVKDAFGVDAWGFDADHSVVDHEIDDDERVRLGDHEYRALHTPGHKDDHLCFYAEPNETLFAGDLIFQDGGFGRTDLEEGDRRRLIESIRRVAETVSTDLEAMHCGHGPSITEDPYSHIELALKMAQY